jgi:glutaminyl-tRNA synthetase
METHDERPSLREHRDFVRERVARDRAAGRAIVTRFPPEPNGYLHIGHAKSICLNFGVAAEFGGRCHLRFDDTNPAAEEHEYVLAIQDDVRWLGFDWGAHLHFASDYFEALYAWAEELVQKGLAYVDDLSVEETREHRGTVTEPGRDSPYRGRAPAESLDLLRRMRAGEFPDGARTLRAKIDMASPNLNLRDPVMYRILRAPHHRTGRAWCIYPTYDWAHGQGDALEGVSHSICTLEFENHRPLYDWFLEHVDLARTPSAGRRPEQVEFARLALTRTVVAKRKLRRLVEEGHVSGWDDPRMPTLGGLRRRGYTPEAIRAFCEEIGVTRANSTIDVGVLENALRADLNRRAPRRMAVLDPLKLVIENYPEDAEEALPADNNPEDPRAGRRSVPFARELWIERDDFRADAPRKFHRLAPGREVRLRYAYYVTATGFDVDPATGAVREVRCRYDPGTRGGDSADGRTVRGTIHWVSARHAVRAEVRLYDHLFACDDPEDVPEGGDFTRNLNPRSLEILPAVPMEPSLRDAPAGTHLQFERKGYFCVDARDSRPGRPVFNRSVSLKDTWKKLEARGQPG